MSRLLRRSTWPIIAVALAACSTPAATSDAPVRQSPAIVTPSPSASTPAPSDSPSSTAAVETPTPGPADLTAVDLRVEPFVELRAPIAMAVRPGDDAVYIAERDGRVVRVPSEGGTATPVLDMSERTTSDAERGLLGLDFSPDGDILYVSYTDPGGDSQLDAYEMQGERAHADSRRALLSVAQPFSNHNGGSIVTGPDGLLYYGLGDGGSAGDPEGNGQDRSTLLGGLLRIAPNARGDGYAVPADNPFVGGEGADELWVYGLRNPWRFSFDAATDDLWIGDVGQGELEEINRLAFDRAAGANLGWNAFEGTQAFAGGSAPDAVAPIFEYPHDGRCSVTGGYVYRGQRIPDLQGAYVFGDFCDGIVRALAVDGDRVVDDRAFDANVPQLASFGQDADGELYALSLGGTVYRIVGG